MFTARSFRARCIRLGWPAPIAITRTATSLWQMGNGVCAQCHLASTYDNPTHHRHQIAAAGSACVDCHMPSQLYMGVDARRDHSMRIPRPDLSMSTGAPNACNQCHTDQSADWAYSALAIGA